MPLMNWVAGSCRFRLSPRVRSSPGISRATRDEWVAALVVSIMDSGVARRLRMITGGWDVVGVEPAAWLAGSRPGLLWLRLPRFSFLRVTEVIHMWIFADPIPRSTVRTPG
ncbi:hypothetical protein Aglo03_24930 [Actinokineospora globicatena]|uniref:Uncharacterized protein n=1 Tax=Actinokineospora globicatena TaxID=103729 RepID=A0A9W6QL93_9PSEU|nr:hypothetical protein Aglo03_24930 [Actinokineospora globicatena]